jgi:hypothetical protein
MLVDAAPAPLLLPQIVLAPALLAPVVLALPLPAEEDAVDWRPAWIAAVLMAHGLPGSSEAPAHVQRVTLLFRALRISRPGMQWVEGM